MLNAATRYVGTNYNSVTEREAQVLSPVGATFSYLWCRLSGAATTAATTVKFRVNGANVSAACTIPTAATTASVVLGSYVITAGDLIAASVTSTSATSNTVFWGLSNLCAGSPLNDPNNCGYCGNVCVGGTCASGSCQGVAFATSASYNGNLGGLAGADAVCQMHADGVGLPGTFSAWLSTDAPVHAWTRVLDQPYVRLGDGLPVAASRADLLDGNPINSISRDETGAAIGGAALTGTASNGTATVGATCSGWTDGVTATLATRGEIVEPVGLPGRWTQYLTGSPCNGGERLYCFQTGPTGGP
jgi:hypothetical protein